MEISAICRRDRISKQNEVAIIIRLYHNGIVRKITSGLRIKVDYWDVDALADAMYALLSYPALGKMAGEQGLEEVNQLKWENAALKVKEVYENVLGI